MCGICGIVAFDGPAPDPARLERMRDSLVHRGPDDAGSWFEGGVALGHRRLSIIDLSARGHQPMASPSGRFHLTYNGEIYNYRELRETLRARGHRFEGESDTEVLAAGLDEWPLEELLPKLDGIFAFAGWDSRERRLVAARDHLGVKPLFYAQHGRELLFASEIKALWAAGVPRSVDPATFEELVVFRFVAGTGTPFRGIQKLAPGHSLIADAAGVRTRAYWRLRDHAHGGGSGPAWVARYQAAVQSQRVSDVPIGTLLSGGLDSSAITAELARTSERPVATFTISIPPEDGLDEAPFADAVSRRWRCDAHVVRVPSGDLLERLCKAQRMHDEPLAHSNDMHLLELCQVATRHVKVLLSGEGADETLAGYVRYRPLLHPFGMRLGTSWATAPLRAVLRRLPEGRMRKLGRALSVGGLTDVLLYNSVNILPVDLEGIGMPVSAAFPERRRVLAEAAEATPDPLRQMILYDLQTFLCSLLDRNDRMTMAASIECRVPFLAAPLVEAALGLPNSALFRGHIGKRVLRDSMRPLLPAEVVDRPKWGFGIPWMRYLREVPECRALLETLHQSPVVEALGATRVRPVIQAFLGGADQHIHLVHQLFSLRVWWEQVVERS